MLTNSTTAARPKLLHIQDPDGPHIHCAADFPAEAIQWLWPNRIPLGSITLLAGDPGTGKSLFAIDLAARVSTATPWPDVPPPFAPSATLDTRNTEMSNAETQLTNDPTFVICHSEIRHSPPASVLILSASDPLSDTIRPRLNAAGADPTRVFTLGNIANLRTDMEKLRLAIDATPNLKLLIIDPINFYVGPGDAHFQTVVRTVLEPLAELARRKKFAILAITHFRKNDGAAIRRAAGSMAFVATARAIWTLAADPRDPARRELVPLKNNLTAPTPGLAFRITRKEISNFKNQMTNDPTFEICHSLSAPHLTWDPTPLDAARGLAPLKPSTPRDEAQNFLRAALADGPRPASELLNLADDRGLTSRTVQRAFHDMEGHSTKQGFQAGWWWSLGEYPIAPIPDLPEIDPLATPIYATDVADKISADQLQCKVFESLVNHAPAKPRRTQATTAKKVSPSPPVSPSRKMAQNSSAAEESTAATPASAPNNPDAFDPSAALPGNFTRAWLLAEDEPSPINNPKSKICNPPPLPQSHSPLHPTPTPAY